MSAFLLVFSVSRDFSQILSTFLKTLLFWPNRKQKPILLFGLKEEKEEKYGRKSEQKLNMRSKRDENGINRIKVGKTYKTENNSEQFVTWHHFECHIHRDKRASF